MATNPTTRPTIRRMTASARPDGIRLDFWAPGGGSPGAPGRHGPPGPPPLGGDHAGGGGGEVDWVDQVTGAAGGAGTGPNVSVSAGPAGGAQARLPIVSV